MKKLTLITDSVGEWERLIVDGKKYFEGHEVPTFVFIELLESLGVEIERILNEDDEPEEFWERYDK